MLRTIARDVPILVELMARTLSGGCVAEAETAKSLRHLVASLFATSAPSCAEGDMPLVERRAAALDGTLLSSC